MHCLVLNELSDDDPSFCKVFKAELDIKSLACKFPSSYHIAIFGCQTLSNAVIDVSEEDGSVLASPQTLSNNFYNLIPNYNLIRIQCLDANQRHIAMSRARERLDLDMNAGQQGIDYSICKQSLYVSMKLNNNEKGNSLQRMQKLMIDASSIEPYTLTFPDLFSHIGKNPNDVGFSLTSCHKM